VLVERAFIRKTVTRQRPRSRSWGVFPPEKPELLDGKPLARFAFFSPQGYDAALQVRNQGASMGIVRVILLRASLLALIAPPHRKVLVSKMPGITATVGQPAAAILAWATASGARVGVRQSRARSEEPTSSEFQFGWVPFADDR
jgi:hypothetical protein